MGGVGDFFFGEDPKVSDPWGGASAPVNQRMIDLLLGNRPYSLGEAYAKPNRYQLQAGGMLSGFDPSSFLGGVKGYLGQGGGYLGQGAGLATGPGAGGSSDLLAKTIGGGFLDVTGGPYAARNQAVSDAAQRFLNQNLDTIGASAQRATGGVGAGSAGTQQKTQAITQTGAQVGEALAKLSAEDLARERAFQSQAMDLGLNLPLQQAGILGNLGQGAGYLGSIFGQAGTAANELGLKQALGLGSFGQDMQQQQLTGGMLPFQMLLQYLSAARGVPLGESAGGFGRFGSALNQFGGAAKNFGAASMFI